MTNTFTTREVAEALGIPEATIRSWGSSGHLSAIARDGAPYIFRLADIAALFVGRKLTGVGVGPQVAFTVGNLAAPDVVAAIDGRAHRALVCFANSGRQTVVAIGDEPDADMLSRGPATVLPVAAIAAELAAALRSIRPDVAPVAGVRPAPVNRMARPGVTRDAR